MAKLTKLAITAALLSLVASVAIAQTAISALPPANVLNGTEVAPVVQSGGTVKATSKAIGFSAVDLANCDTGTGGNAYALITLNANGSSANPSGLQCTNNGGGNPLAWDFSNKAQLFPDGGRIVAGAGAGSAALSICIGPSGGTWGNCSGAMLFHGGGSGAIFTQRGLVLTGDGYIVASGSQPSFTGTCTLSSSQGGASAGKLTVSSTGACTLIITLPFTDGGNTGQAGLVCSVTNITTAVIAPMSASDVASFNPFCTVNVTASPGDLLVYSLIGY